MYRKMVLTLVLVCSQSASADAAPQLEWGRARHGLRMSIASPTFKAAKRTLAVQFTFQNVGKKTVTLREKLSCSGYEGYTLELTPRPVAPAARRKALVLRPAIVACDKNVPIFRTLGPKDYLAAFVTFVLPPTVKAGRYRLLGRVSLRVRGRAKPLKVRSKSQAITLRGLKR
jgi:hypothetical protein